MCKPKTPPPATVVAPPPPAEIPKPLGVDEESGPEGIAALRSSKRNNLSIRGQVTGTSSLAIPSAPTERAGGGVTLAKKPVG